MSSQAASFRWSDLDASDAWAKRAIDFVGKANDWMRDFAERPDGSVPFRPDMLETRKYLARTLVKVETSTTPAGGASCASATATAPPSDSPT